MQLAEQLEAAERLRAANCPSARERGKTICRLAERICGLVDRDPNVVSVERHCDDARARCRTARSRTESRCH
jgi:hypothetical protein